MAKTRCGPLRITCRGCAAAATGCRRAGSGIGVANPPPRFPLAGGPSTFLLLLHAPRDARPRSESRRQHLRGGSGSLPRWRPSSAHRQGHRLEGECCTLPRRSAICVPLVHLRRGRTAGGAFGGFAAAGSSPPRGREIDKFSHRLPVRYRSCYEGCISKPRYRSRVAALGGAPRPHAGNADAWDSAIGLDILRKRFLHIATRFGSTIAPCRRSIAHVRILVLRNGPRREGTVRSATASSAMAVRRRLAIFLTAAAAWRCAR